MRKNLAVLALLALAGCATPSPQRPLSAPPPAAGVPIPPPPAKGEPVLFTGIDVSRLRALVGMPVFTRKDGAVEMWRYDAQSCHAFFFLTGAPPRVQHVETMPRGKTGAADPDCLNALMTSSKRS